MEKEQIGDYLSGLSKKLQKRATINRPYSDIANFPFAKGQCVYILDFQKRALTFQTGIKEFLGYDPKEFTFDRVVGSYHPNDHNMVSRLVKATLSFASENNVQSEVGFLLTYRVRKKDGSYVKVLRQSNVFEIDKSGKIISNVSVLTDISFIDSSERVQWKFDAPGLDQKKFKTYVTKEYEGFFSERELDVLKLLKEGTTSSAIAHQLFISKHTVDGHRRNMLRKSNCTNTIDLINFCKINGLI